MPRVARVRSVVFLVSLAGVLAWALAPGPALSHEAVRTSVTFDKEISRILVRRCIQCHADGRLSFPMTTYEETRPWARAIEEEVLSRQMPPWRAVAGYGRFANDGGLTQREAQTVLAWVEGAGPKTSEERIITNIDQRTTAVEDRLKPQADQWQFGSPDHVRPVPIAGDAAGPRDRASVVRATVDLALDADRRVRALEFRPSEHGRLRAAFFWLEGSNQWLGSWTPWHGGVTLPPGAAYRLPRGARVVAELHYQPGDVRAGDAGQLGLSYATAAAQCPSDVVLRATAALAPGAANQKLQAASALPGEATLLALVPDVTPGMKSIEVRARMPNGAVRVLLLVREILHEWPTPYILASPMPLPKGTELVATSYYDNPGAERRDAALTVRASVFTAGTCG
jgi:hypothetical protein